MVEVSADKVRRQICDFVHERFTRGLLDAAWDDEAERRIQELWTLCEPLGLNLDDVYDEAEDDLRAAMGLHDA